MSYSNFGVIYYIYTSISPSLDLIKLYSIAGNSANGKPSSSIPDPGTNLAFSILASSIS